ncbi:cytochrome b/b6 domain-containing protein [Paenalcaligenes niemegkensis]|uniref:cytochrome b n=1 Tax=Paenalcaligenes niemegkensis TaxID=2895469 RepID=UPI001EE97616|nr:cytochrome b/b6 domain-containing protein [Paenalcaligenes niemegkensis]MCQ9617468.1 cytochrome b/b6 domain-containing protein [Paenalcaligenes niemegkensis]
MSSSTLTPSVNLRPYDSVTRFFHWAMAVGFAWMLFTALVRFFADETPLSDAVWPWHRPVGFTLFLLWWLRAAWAFMHRAQYQALSMAAKWGHRFIYALMLAVPSIALLRQYGSGRAFNYFGIPVMQASDNTIKWMTDLGGLLHGELGWLLFATVLGHVSMVFWHRRDSQTNVLPKMLG